MTNLRISNVLTNFYAGLIEFRLEITFLLNQVRSTDFEMRLIGQFSVQLRVDFVQLFFVFS